MFFSLASVTFSLLIQSYTYQTGQTVTYKQIDNLQYMTAYDYGDTYGYDDLMSFPYQEGNGNFYVFPEVAYQITNFSPAYYYDDNTVFYFSILMKSTYSNGASSRVVTLPFIALHLEYDIGQNSDYSCFWVDNVEYEGVGVGYNYIPMYQTFGIGRNSSTPGGSFQFQSTVSYTNYEAIGNSSIDIRFTEESFEASSTEYADGVICEYIGFQYLPYPTVDSYDNTDFYQGYDSGYNTGYSDGYTEGENYGHGVGYSEGYSDGERDGLNNGHITEIFTNVASVGLLPVNVFLKIFNLEVYGVNIADIVTSLLTIGLIIIIFRVIFGGKADTGNGN